MVHCETGDDDEPNSNQNAMTTDDTRRPQRLLLNRYDLGRDLAAGRARYEPTRPWHEIPVAVDALYYSNNAQSSTREPTSPSLSLADSANSSSRKGFQSPN